MILFSILFIILLLYFCTEKAVNDRCLASFTAVIHVNGIRGKTSTCRCIDAVLRQKYRCFTKTTGTDAMMIHVDGTQSPVKRLGPANIHEQLRIIRRAKKEGAEILILECMAVNPLLQKTAQEQIVKSNITVITNVRYDHVFEMGDTLEEIAQSLSATVPEKGTLYTADPNFCDFFDRKCREKNSRLVFCPSGNVSKESTSIAREIGKSFGIGEEEFREGIGNVLEDFGVRKIYRLKNKNGEEFSFLNLFSVNDPMSTVRQIESLSEEYVSLSFLYNHRGDRPDRAFLFARYFFPNYRNHTVWMVGTDASLPRRLFSRAGVEDLKCVRDYRECLDQPAGSLLIGIGNIKGAGYKMIETLEMQN